MFPGNDSSVAANLELLAGEHLDAGAVLEDLGPRRCHRRLIADALVLDGFEVRHLIDHMPGQLHRLQSGVRRDDAGVVICDGVVLEPDSVGLPPGGA